MVMAYGLSTNVMSKNVSRDKEMKGNLMAITTALEIMGINASSGWLASEKLKAVDRLAIESEIESYTIETGRTKLTTEKAKDWIYKRGYRHTQGLWELKKRSLSCRGTPTKNF